MIKGRVKQAEAIVKFVANTSHYDIALADSITHIPRANLYDLISTAEMRRITVPLAVVWTAFGFTYYGIILFVLRLYTSSEISTCSFDYQSIFINICAEFAGVTIGVLVT
jgi:hypothetical protein